MGVYKIVEYSVRCDGDDNCDSCDDFHPHDSRSEAEAAVLAAGWTRHGLRLYCQKHRLGGRLTPAQDAELRRAYAFYRHGQPMTISSSDTPSDRRRARSLEALGFLKLLLGTRSSKNYEITAAGGAYLSER